jgi:hypothetical protein
MTKISVCSDLHLEFGYQELPGGEVLILAGDICEARSFKKQFHSTRVTDANPGTYRYCDFFYKECAKYDRVFYVMGNHEHYHGRFDRTKIELEEILPKNVRILENEFEIYNGVLYLGATLWTDCDRGNPVSLHQIKYGMNDFRYIKNYYVNKNLYYNLTPEHTVDVHKNTLRYFQEVLTEHSSMPCVVITHHAPSHLSIHPRYINAPMNGAYVSDLSNFILDNENIRVWVHGHNHDQFSYPIGKTQVMSNPRGYVGHEDTSEFDPGFFFKVDG